MATSTVNIACMHLAIDFRAPRKPIDCFLNLFGIFGRWIHLIQQQQVGFFNAANAQLEEYKHNASIT